MDCIISSFPGVDTHENVTAWMWHVPVGVHIAERSARQDLTRTCWSDWWGQRRTAAACHLVGLEFDQSPQTWLDLGANQWGLLYDIKGNFPFADDQFVCIHRWAFNPCGLKKFSENYIMNVSIFLLAVDDNVFSDAHDVLDISESCINGWWNMSCAHCISISTRQI